MPDIDYPVGYGFEQTDIERIKQERDLFARAIIDIAKKVGLYDFDTHGYDLSGPQILLLAHDLADIGKQQ